MSETKRTFKEDIAMIKEGYKILLRIDKNFIFYPVIIAMIYTFFPFINLYMSARILTELTGARDWRTLVNYAMITVGLNLILSIIRRFVETKRNIYIGQFEQRLSLFLLDISNNMQYEHLENPQTNMLMDRITYQMYHGHGIWKLYWAISNVIDNILSIIFSVSLTVGMFTLNASGDTSFINSPYSLIIILAVIIINTSVGMWIGKNQTEQTNKAFEGIAATNAVSTYYGRNVYSNLGGMDIRLYKQSDIISSEVSKVFENAEFLNITEKITHKFTSARTLLNTACNIIIYTYVGAKAFTGAFGIGLFVQYTGCVGRFVSGVSNLISEVAGLRHNNVYLKNEIAYVNMPNDMYRGTLPVEKRSDGEYVIEFKNVSFKYPGTDTNRCGGNYALKNLSMKLRIGQKLAVVGMNGSGKTTMIKLLCRLYDPTEGEITLNGVDIKKYKYDQYLNIFSVVFQDFELFSFTLGQNIATSVEYDSDNAEQCLNKAGFGDRLKTMPKGLETPLYKSFEDDGVEISGGEAQKIALARALYKNSPFIILDEPTSALDPIAEFEVYSKFNEIVDEKTAIYISHRLSSCRFCDDIAVFHEGELIQRGSHGTLIADENGKYHELWNAQAQYYTENVENCASPV